MPIPGLLGLDHYAFAVPRLADAVDFFCEVLGAGLVMELELEPVAGSWMSDQLDVHARVSAHAAQLRLGPVTNIELWEYAAPDRRPRPPRLNERGGHALTFAVGDVDRAAGYMERQDGVRVFGEPVDETEASSEARWIMFETPWGLPMKLLSTTRSTTSDEWPTGSRIPTARYVDGLSVTVPDLDVAVRALRQHFGVEVDSVMPASPLSERFMTRQFGLDGRENVWRRTLLRLGSTTHLEVIEFTGAPLVGEHPRNSDVGGHHIALAVDDVDLASDYLRRRDNVEVFGVPQRVLDGQINGDHWQYFRLSWGLYGEILNMPRGVPFGKTHAWERYEFA